MNSGRQAILTTILMIASQLISYAHGPVHEQIERLTKLIQNDPENATLYVERSSYYKIDLNFDLAYADLSKAQVLDPSLASLHFLYAELFFEFDYPNSALFHLNLFQKTGEIPGETFLLKSKIFNQLLEADSALIYVEKAYANIKHPRTDLFVYAKDMSMYQDPKDFDRAYSWLELGKKHHPRDLVLQDEMIKLCVRYEQFDKARELCQAQISKLKRKESWYVKLAEIEMQDSNYADALTALSRAEHSIDKLPQHIVSTLYVKQLSKEIESMRSIITQQLSSKINE